MYQKVVVVGRLTKDPNQFKYGQDGVGVGLTIAADAGRDNTTFYNAVAFGKNAENIIKFFKKGRPIVAEGRMENDNREREQNGVKVMNYGMNFVIERWSFAGDSANGSAGGQAPAQNNNYQQPRQQQQPQQQQNDFNGFNISDDDVPF